MLWGQLQHSLGCLEGPARAACFWVAIAVTADSRLLRRLGILDSTALESNLPMTGKQVNDGWVAIGSLPGVPAATSLRVLSCASQCGEPKSPGAP